MSFLCLLVSYKGVLFVDRDCRFFYLYKWSSYWEFSFFVGEVSGILEVVSFYSCFFMSRQIIIFDTTLRDGEQVPGAKLNTVEKIEVAKQLERLGVDVMEAGFPISSPEDLQAVKHIAREVKNSTVCALSRAVSKDIEAAYEAVKEAQSPRIHTFISTSDIHLKHQIKKSKDEVKQMTRQAVAQAKGLVSDVEFSAMDASRSDRDFLYEIIEIALKEGATTINIPDTVGYAITEEWEVFIREIYERFPVFEDEVVLSVHVHDDLGLATANSLAGIRAGARQVECTINGIGERAGNASLEEIVMALETRYSNFQTQIKTKEIYRTSRLVSQLMGMVVQPNKAIVGANAFAHASGIHQHGVINKRSTFEVIDPRLVGIDSSGIVLTSRSGKAALKMRLENIGYEVEAGQLEDLYQRFIMIADRKKEVYDEDLHLLMERDLDGGVSGSLALELVQVLCGNEVVPMSVVRLKIDGQLIETSASGTGPVDAAFSAIDQLVKQKVVLEEYLVQAVTEGIDAQARVSVVISHEDKKIYGYGADTDIVVASARAYVSALNQIN